MRRGILVIMMFLAFALPAMAHGERDTLGAGTQVQFVENLGQWDARVKYEVQLHDAALFLEEDGVMVALRERNSHPHPTLESPAKDDLPRCHAYKMRFVDCVPTVPTGIGRLEGHSNYFLGNEPSRWRSKVGSYAAAHYEGVWPGVSLDIYGGSKALKYNFIVSPGADAKQIALEYEGAEDVKVNSRTGTLSIQTSVRQVIESKPYVYQIDEAGNEVEVKSRWRVEKKESGSTETETVWKVWIELGNYDSLKPLVIDPVLIFSTYTGSTSDNWGTTAAYDAGKNAYTAGLVFGIGYPVSTGAYSETPGGIADIGIFKFDTSGQNRLYATYLGGSSADMPHSLFVNSFDELIVFGTTGSDNFPVTADAYQTTHAGGTLVDYENTSSIRFPNGSDIFVSRFSADGSQLMASTYVGGSGNDGLNYYPHFNSGNNPYAVIMGGNDSLYYNYGDGARGELITDNLNNVYVGSTTMSADFPTTTGCVQPASGGKQDGVVFKLDHNMKNMLWCTYLGGSGNDAVYSIDVDTAYNLLACGGTCSANFPVTDSTWQHSYGGGTADGFVSKISYNGDRLMASTYVGDQSYDQLYFIRTGRRDEVFLFGQTKPLGHTTFIHNAGYSVYNSGMLLMRMTPDLRGRVWSTLFGTPGRINLSPTAFAADICNRVYAAGWGRDFVNYNGVHWNTAGTEGMETTADAWSDTTDGQDFYILSVDENNGSLVYASFFGELHDPNSYFSGGDHVDGGTSRFDRHATLYQSVCGSCGGTQRFPTSAGAWSDSNRAGNCNNAIFRFGVSDDFPVAEFIPPSAGCAPYSVDFRNTGRGTSFYWDFGDGGSSTERNPSHTYSQGGIYTVTLIARMPGGCSEADTQRHTLHVVGDNNSFEPLISCSGHRIQIGLQPQLGSTYQWLTEGVSDPTVANPWVSQSGTYLLRVSAAGCSETDTFKVESYTLVDLWQPTAISCHDSADGSAYFRLGPGIDPDSVTLTLTGPSSTAVCPPPTFFGRAYTYTGLAAGSYHLLATGYGCTYEQDFTLDNPALPYYEKSSSLALCSDSCEGWVEIRYNFSAIPEIQPLDTLITGLCEGAHVTHLTSMGCPLTDTTVIGRNHQLDSLRAWADSYEVFVGATVNLHATTGSTSNQISYHWSPESDIERPNVADPVATVTDTTECYTVTATTQEGCTATNTVCVKGVELVCGPPDYVIPNAFTPNDDGINDVVDFGSPMLTEIHVAVFNRWGECVFESEDLTRCTWDGMYRNARCLPGVYTYTCRIRCVNQVETELKGDITLIR